MENVKSIEIVSKDDLEFLLLKSDDDDCWTKEGWEALFEELKRPVSFIG